MLAITDGNHRPSAIAPTNVVVGGNIAIIPSSQKGDDNTAEQIKNDLLIINLLYLGQVPNPPFKRTRVVYSFVSIRLSAAPLNGLDILKSLLFSFGFIFLLFMRC